jgi:hypothetical protein
MVRGNAGSAIACGYVDLNGVNRFANGTVGEHGIEPGKWYCVQDGVLAQVS